jgi:HPt (histidine-containing phosphotransfer) domain-containing protein
MPIPPTLDGFDVVGAVERMLDQPALWWQAVGLFVQHFAGWEKDWQTAIGDDARERKQVHAMRSAAANVGAVRLAASAEALEQRLLDRLAGRGAQVPDDLRQRLSADFRAAWQAADHAWRTDTAGPGGEA